MQKILVLDDEVRIVEILERFLTRMGYQVLTAYDGEKALEILKSQEKVDLLVLDIRMPKLTGIDVLQELKKTGIKLPIIILSGSLELHKYIDEIKSLGFSEESLMYKPVDLFALLDKIKNALAQTAEDNTTKL